MRWKVLSAVLGSAIVAIVLTFTFGPFGFDGVRAQGGQAAEVGRARIGVLPRLITYQGLLTVPGTGQPVPDATRTFVFRLYTSQSGGSLVWAEIRQIQTRNGIFTTVLGNESPFDPSIVAAPELWLDIQIQPDPEMTPRQRVTGSIYAVGAVEAQVSETVGVNSEKIALRQWYNLNLARPPRLDLGWRFKALAGGGGDSTVLDAYSGTIQFRPIDVDADVVGLFTDHKGLLFVVTEQAFFFTDGRQLPVTGQFHFANGCTSFVMVGAKKACASGTEVLIYGEPQGSVIQRGACAGCRHVAFDGSNIWATSPDNDTASKVDISMVYETDPPSSEVAGGYTYPFPRDPQLVGTFAVGDQPSGVEFDGSQVWVANKGDDTVTVLDPSDGSTLATIGVGDAPTKVLFDGASIWVLNVGDGSLTQIDASSKSIRGTYIVGSAPVDISFDGSTIWVASSGDDSIVRLRATDGSVIDIISLFGAPHFLQFDGVGTWVATLEDQPRVSDLDTGTETTPPTFFVEGVRWFVTRY